MKKLLLVLSVVAMASFLFVGCLPGAVTPDVNNAPEITSTAITSATVGEAYTYDVDATDPDEGDVLTYSLVAKPADMAIVATTGVISWTPVAAGTFSVVVSVSDGELSDTQSFSITVSEAEVPPEPVNNAPEITSAAITSVILGETYTYDVDATDADEDPLTYSLIPLTGFIPVGMTINAATGVISWTPTALGVYPVTVQVSDGELTDTQSFTVTVSPVPVGPTVVSLLPLAATVGEAYVGQVTATPGDAAIASYALTDPPAGMIISAAGIITWTPTAAGSQLVTVVVTNGAGLSDTEVFTIVVEARVKPVIAAIVVDHIHWGELFSLQVELTAGTDPTPTYTLAATRVANAIGLTISGTGLITWTPLAIQNGLYEVTVTATDTYDSSLFDTEVFTILVEDPEPPAALSAAIVYAPTHSHNDGTTTFVRGGSGDDCVGVTVTLSEAVGDDDVVNIRWNDGEAEGSWVPLTGNTANLVFTGDLCFDNAEIVDCELVCVEVQLVTPDLFCPACEGVTTLIHTETVKVDKVDPCASFVVTVEDCGDFCSPFGLSISWTSECAGECDPLDCCYDYCSGVNGWEFVLDASADPICNPGECDTVIGNGCVPSIEGQFGCGLDCLIWADSGETVTYTIDYSISDNVGNEFTDTWTITVDTDSVTAFDFGTSDSTDNGGGTYSVDYGCPGAACLDCYPIQD